VVFVTAIELYWLGKTFPGEVRGTADPSTSLRFGRDDKGEGGASSRDGIVAESGLRIGGRSNGTAGPYASVGMTLHLVGATAGWDDKGGVALPAGIRQPSEIG
jgi:hypothetical protein